MSQDELPTRQSGKLISLLRRALGTEGVAERLAEIIAAEGTINDATMRSLGDLKYLLMDERTRLADKHEQDVERTSRQVMERLLERGEQLHAHSLAFLHKNIDETHGLIAHLDHRLESLLTQAVLDLYAHLHASLVEQRRLQNASFSRDQMPSALAVKTFYLQLKSLACRCDFDEIGLSVFSQNSEDGILMYIFSIIGMTSKRSIEIGCDLSASTIGIPEGNSVNLICNFGFDGLIIDIDPEKTAGIQNFFALNLATKHFHRPAMDGLPADYFSPAVMTAEIDVDNINSVFVDAGFRGEIDLLSIDVDGPDLSLWRAVREVSPRVVVIEVNNRIPFESIVAGSYSTSDAPPDSLEQQQSRSSSLGAICQLGADKGYVFVGMDTTLLNAFFVRQDVWDERLPQRSPADYATHRLNPLLDRSARDRL